MSQPRNVFYTYEWLNRSRKRTWTWRSLRP